MEELFINEEKRNNLSSNSLNNNINTKNEKSTWTERIFNSTPELKEFYERISPVHRTIAFGRHYEIGKSKNAFIITLIGEYLCSKGLYESAEILEEESGIPFSKKNENERDDFQSSQVDHSVPESQQILNNSNSISTFQVRPPSPQLNSMSTLNANLLNSNSPTKLLSHLKTAVSHSERIYDFAISDKPSNFYDQNNLESLFYQFGLTKDETENNLDIWLEPDDSERLEVEKNSNNNFVVKAGTLNALVKVLTSNDMHSLDFIQLFLMTYQSFCTPQTLMEKLLQRIIIPSTFLPNHPEREKIINQVKFRVINVIKLWLETYPNHFENSQILHEVKNLIYQLEIQGEKSLSSLLSSSLLNLKKKKITIFSQKPPEPNIPKNIFSSSLSFFDIEEEEIARQLTLIDSKIFMQIKSDEFLNQSWIKPKLKKKAGNIITFINRFNKISYWVAGTILSERKLKDRVRAMVKFINIAKELRNLNNFNGLMAIIAAFNFSSIHRLQHTWDKVDYENQEIFLNLEKLMSSENGHENYRTAIYQCKSSPTILYLGVHLTDLTFVDENSDFVLSKNSKTPLINFSKRYLISKIIREIQIRQGIKHNLEFVFQISDFLKNEKLEKYHFDEMTMTQKSLRLEPRDVKVSKLL